MYNSDFWEIRIDQKDLERFPNESGVWFEDKEEQEDRYEREELIRSIMPLLMDVMAGGLTERQRNAVLLYFIYRKTQREIADILGISRRVLSQHLFGICRNGKHVGGAVKKLRKLCDRQGIRFQVQGQDASRSLS